MAERLTPAITELSGKWMTQGKALIADQTCRRIEELITNFLKRIAVSKDGWEILYKDPTDGRYWELTYPNSERQGGGPPKLTVISSEEAEFKYHINNK